MAYPASLVRDITPPPPRKTSTFRPLMSQAAREDGGESEYASKPAERLAQPSLAAIEAGQAQIRDHLSYFTKIFQQISRPISAPDPRLDISDFRDLYERNQHRRGRHFVIHQHDHPISGVHYDLRLQFSESSTVSFAVPYGMPGNPNSMRPNRMAIETRVHTLWNNLIESASHATGSLLIWDTGEYEILPRKEAKAPTTDDELSETDNSHSADGRSESDKLFAAFQRRHIRLRLHGTRLPPGYTVSLRLPSGNDRDDRSKRSRRKRRRVEHVKMARQTPETSSESDARTEMQLQRLDEHAGEGQNDEAGIASDNDEDAAIRANNAYTGSSNTIGSVHQRHWFLTLDRRSSGFHKARNGPDEGTWIGSWGPFFVRGRDHERSVVTGRSAGEVMEDEGVGDFVGRKMWRPILE